MARAGRDADGAQRELDKTWEVAEHMAMPLLVELTVPESLVTLGGGPSFVAGHIDHSCGFWCEAPPPSDYKGVGFDWRVGFTFGARRPTVRGGFTVELAGHHTAYDTAVVLGIGADLF